MKQDEKILVVPREQLFVNGEFQGFMPLTSFEVFEKNVIEYRQFHWRSAMETDPAYKQIIPYLVFKHADTYFLMRRRSDASEARLRDKCTLGIGGHLREEDMQDVTIAQWAAREFHEEVAYAGKLTITPLGVINDDSDLVGQVHIGFVYLLEGDSAEISIKSELKEGALCTLDQVLEKYEALEGWSKLTVEHLKTRLITPAIKTTRELIL